MARLAPDVASRARDLIALYPEKRSALLPLLHLLQEQDGYLTTDGMEHVAEMLDLTPAEVYGTASFYDMFFTHPVGKYVVAVCTNIACLLAGADELLEHAESRLGVRAGGTTADGAITLEEFECLGECGAAPCLTVNWRFRSSVTPESFDRLVDDLRADRLADEIPPHGTLVRIRRSVGLPGAVAAAAAARRAQDVPEMAPAAPPAPSAPGSDGAPGGTASAGGGGPAEAAGGDVPEADASAAVSPEGSTTSGPTYDRQPVDGDAVEGSAADAEAIEHPEGADTHPEVDGRGAEKGGD